MNAANTTLIDPDDPHGLRVITFGTKPIDVPENVYLGTLPDGRVEFRNRAGVVRRARPDDVVAVLDVERADTVALDVLKERRAVEIREAEAAAKTAAALRSAEDRLRRELVVVLEHHGVRGDEEREPYAELERQGIARAVGTRMFALDAPERDFTPAPPGGLVWIAQDPALPPGVRMLVGWRGLSPVACSVNGGVPTVVTLTGRWTLPVAGSWRDWADLPPVSPEAVESRLARRLERGATLPVMSSEEAHALAVLAAAGRAREINPREFVSS